MSIYSNEIKKITEIIRKVCNPVVRDFHEIQRIRDSRNISDFFKHCYTRVENFLVYELKDYKEKAQIDYKIILFPIDGKRNFINGIPFFTVSVLLKYENEPFICVIEAPLFNCTFWAEKDSGAFLEDLTGVKRLKVSNTSDINNALVLINSMEADSLVNFNNYRYFGSNTLNAAYVACGSADAFIIDTKKVNYNMVLLAKLIIEESKGKVLQHKDELIFSNFNLAENIKNTLEEI
jgi:myo-inositol-1(or 4)-monophosphatase